MSSPPMPQNMARCLTTLAEYQSDGSGCRMEFRSSSWPSNGKRPTARLFQPQALLAMGQASFANFSHMNSGERLIFRLLPAASNVDWRFLLSGLVPTMTPSIVLRPLSISPYFAAIVHLLTCREGLFNVRGDGDRLASLKGKAISSCQPLDPPSNPPFDFFLRAGSRVPTGGFEPPTNGLQNRKTENRH